MSSRPLSADRRRSLTDVVRSHKVVYDVSRAQRVVAEQLRDIGFDVTLAGTHEPGVPHPIPDCGECLEVWDTLRELAAAVMPIPSCQSSYELRTFDHSVHIDPAHGFRKDVELVITIRHTDDYLGPIDACERTCLEDLRQALEALGVREGRWD
ncbi:hypothetical protein L6R52_06300 [Myxococcota bacterium]|nr:hypothetical protein [Myxococcota bacterium]